MHDERSATNPVRQRQFSVVTQGISAGRAATDFPAKPGLSDVQRCTDSMISP
jgi:hypothetical protein